MKKTVERVLTEFHRPGVQADIRSLFRSCDICQRTITKGREPEVPLGQMPIISELFQRIAVDLVGPLHPITDRGNRFILTIIDNATRYPEAIALPVFDAESMPNPDSIFSKLTGMRFVTKIDLSKGYWQVPMEDESKPLTGFFHSILVVSV